MIRSNLRQVHSYIGLFIAPSVLFFALTGAVQIFNLHEAHGSYRPAVWVEMLSAVHKDQVFEQPHEHAAHDAGPETAPPADEPEKTSPATLALKWFFLTVALGLGVSTSIGIWMGITQIRRKALAWTLLIAGALAPVCLLAI